MINIELEQAIKNHEKIVKDIGASGYLIGKEWELIKQALTPKEISDEEVNNSVLAIVREYKHSGYHYLDKDQHMSHIQNIRQHITNQQEEIEAYNDNEVKLNDVINVFRNKRDELQSKLDKIREILVRSLPMLNYELGAVNVCMYLSVDDYKILKEYKEQILGDEKNEKRKI